jgi:CRISPR system Cascade subunit CasE
VTALYLSRIRLREDASVAALAGLLVGPNADEHTGRTHQLLWSLFADSPDRRRDFLWRDDGGSGWRRRTFLTLSVRPPEDRVRLFEVETKPFEPVLTAGQHLRFRLRASPSVSMPASNAKRGMRKDPVALALKKLPEAERPRRRYDVLQQEGRRWLAKQAERAGFRLPEGAPLLIDGEDHRALPRNGKPPIRFPVLDLEGILELTEPAAFRTALAQGFGRAKAFGCGLMLIRPA